MKFVQVRPSVTRTNSIVALSYSKYKETDKDYIVKTVKHSKDNEGKIIEGGDYFEIVDDDIPEKEVVERYLDKFIRQSIKYHINT